MIWTCDLKIAKRALSCCATDTALNWSTYSNAQFVSRAISLLYLESSAGFAWQEFWWRSKCYLRLFLEFNQGPFFSSMSNLTWRLIFFEITKQMMEDKKMIFFRQIKDQSYPSLTPSSVIRHPFSVISEAIGNFRFPTKLIFELKRRLEKRHRD